MKRLTLALLLSVSATAAFAQDHYNNAPGLIAPGMTNIPGIRDEPPGSRPDPSPYQNNNRQDDGYNSGYNSGNNSSYDPYKSSAPRDDEDRR